MVDDVRVGFIGFGSVVLLPANEARNMTMIAGSNPYCQNLSYQMCANAQVEFGDLDRLVTKKIEETRDIKWQEFFGVRGPNLSIYKHLDSIAKTNRTLERN